MFFGTKLSGFYSRFTRPLIWDIFRTKGVMNFQTICIDLISHLK
nr:MAG TPA: hypothetical protein [Caudoviricetes sp.]